VASSGAATEALELLPSHEHEQERDGGSAAAPQAAGQGDGGAWPCRREGAEDHCHAVAGAWPTPARWGRYSDEASSSGLRSSLVHCTRILRNREIGSGRAMHGIRPLGGDSPTTIAHVA
jgi:hypothetical protein